MDSLLKELERLFTAAPYNPRSSTQGDVLASYLYEDMLAQAESSKFVMGVQSSTIAVNTGNRIKGKKGRRGDGTLGRLIPGEVPDFVPGFSVPRGPIANLQIGAEVKLAASEIIGQIGRVQNDLREQADTFHAMNPKAIRVAIVPVNFADEFTTYLGKHEFPATVPPGRVAAEGIRRLEEKTAPQFDELLILPFRATNRPPFRFHWVNEQETKRIYRSALLRISHCYQDRF